MKLSTRVWAICAVLSLSVGAANAARAKHASESRYHDTITLFKHAGKSAKFFEHSYAYAVFPTVGEGAFVVGGARGKGHVYVHGKWSGDVTMNEVSVGLQAGGKAYSQIIFFKDQRALDEFESGSFEFGADAGAVAITASAEASAATDGQGSGMSGGMKDAVTHGDFYKGMAVFTIAKGGLMVQASVAGQKFTFTPRDAA